MKKIFITIMAIVATLSPLASHANEIDPKFYDISMGANNNLWETNDEWLTELKSKKSIFGAYWKTKVMLFSDYLRLGPPVSIDYTSELYTVSPIPNGISSLRLNVVYAANDLMNVSFVFIVEGKQDRNRLPLLLEKYYSEIYNNDGQLNRIAIIATNSCTNIKTYANLKYINTLYLKDQFLMIRDGDGKDARMLKDQLTNYYRERAKEDYGNLPRVTDRNVLILKYYSFENYFLDPEVMVKIGVVKSVDAFYDILYEKYNEYLYKLKSTRNMIEKTGITISSRQDIIDNMELIRKYVRGHNLYDIFYGRYKGKRETDILKKYIDVAPKSNFDDIFDAIDQFVYFNNRVKE